MEEETQDIKLRIADDDAENLEILGKMAAQDMETVLQAKGAVNTFKEEVETALRLGYPVEIPEDIDELVKLDQKLLKWVNQRVWESHMIQKLSSALMNDEDDDF